MNGRNSFADMDTLIKALYNDGIVADESVNEYIEKQKADEKLLKELLAACGLTRKLIPWDKSSLENWRKWNFSDEMLLCAAEAANGKANPVAYMNTVLSAWKSKNIFSPDKIPIKFKGTYRKRNSNNKPSLVDQWQSVLKTIDELENNHDER